MPRALTLLELLVVLAAASILTAILLPVAAKVRSQARTIRCMTNQRAITRAVNLFAADNDSRYPESVATIGAGNSWHWQEPTMMIACKERRPRLHRAMSEYLGRYIKDASVMFCPEAPHKYKYLQEAWDAGDRWNHPKTAPWQDPLTGTYCFYWNYTGFVGGRRPIFAGPRRFGAGRGQSKLLVSDYFGYDHWRSRNAFGSCVKFKRADITEGTWVSSAFWSRIYEESNISLDTLKIKLHAGYVDGHVESFRPSEAEAMQVSITSDGSKPYPRWMGPGIFYLPGNALH